jgi:hypothetical protein
MPPLAYAFVLAVMRLGRFITFWAIAILTLKSTGPLFLWCYAFAAIKTIEMFHVAPQL